MGPVPPGSPSKGGRALAAPPPSAPTPQPEPCPCDPRPLNWVDLYIAVHFLFVLAGYLSLVVGFPNWPMLATVTAATWLFLSLTSFGMMMDGVAGFAIEFGRTLLALACVHKFPDALLAPVAATLQLTLATAKTIATIVLVGSMVVLPAVTALSLKMRMTKNKVL